MVVCVVVAALAVAGGIFLRQLQTDPAPTTSPEHEATTDARSGLLVGGQVSSVNGLDIPLPEGFRLGYEGYYPHLDSAMVEVEHTETAHRAQIYTFLQPGAYPDAETACRDYQRDLSSELGGEVTLGEVQPLETSGELTAVTCSLVGENEELGTTHYEYRAYTFSDGRTVLQQTRLPDLQVEINAERHEVYRAYFTCLINDTYEIGLAECA